MEEGEERRRREERFRKHAANLLLKIVVHHKLLFSQKRFAGLLEKHAAATDVATPPTCEIVSSDGQSRWARPLQLQPHLLPAAALVVPPIYFKGGGGWGEGKIIVTSYIRKAARRNIEFT